VEDAKRESRVSVKEKRQSSAIADLASKINLAALGGGSNDPYSNPNHPLYKAKVAREAEEAAKKNESWGEPA